MFSEYSVYIGEILVNLRISLMYFQISSLYIVKSVKSLIFVILSSSLCVQVNVVLTSGEKREGSLHRFVYLYFVSILKQLTVCLSHSFALYINLKFSLFS